MRLKSSILFVLLAFLHLQFSLGQAAAQNGAEADSSPHSSAALIAEHSSIQPGTPFDLGLHMLMDPGWHSYWENPGDAGEATYIEWDLPEGFEAGEIQWPHPERIDAGPLRSYGYSDVVTLIYEITPPADLEPGTSVEISGTAYWLICEEICLPAEEEIGLTLPVQATAPATGPHAPLFTTARSLQPRNPIGWGLAATRNSGSYVLQITPPEASLDHMEGAYFFPSGYDVLHHAAPQPMSREGDTFLLALQASEYAAAPADQLRGVLVAGPGKMFDPVGNVHALSVDVPVAAADRTLSADETQAAESLWWIMVLAGLGGLLLNLMPCVFPVLSLKILGLAKQSRDDRRAIRRHGLVFGGGVIISFWALAGLLLALRAGGSQIGWGFQLQSPLFIGLMALLFFVIGLNLIGVFEMGTGLMRLGGRLSGAGNSTSYRGSFMSGVLATIVATPCTAPFMGAALGAAVVLPAFQALLVFTALGAGMAMPYVVFSMAPALLQRLPEPGAWMETLKQVLAFPMLATTVWLVWVFGRQTSIDGTALLLLALLLVGMALWILGRWPALQLSTQSRLWTRGSAIAMAAAAFLLMVAGVNEDLSPSGKPVTQASAWENYSAERVEALRSEGRPVFIDFTAAWCLTCQVNKRTSLNTSKVLAAFEARNVALIQADWTNQDPEITRALDALGRTGVPLYVLYAGTMEDPVLLPEILTEGIILDALENIPRTGSLPVSNASD